MTYNRRHLHASVGAATALGIALGFWLGKRLDVAGFLECLAVYLAMAISLALLFAKIDGDHPFKKSG